MRQTAGNRTLNAAAGTGTRRSAATPARTTGGTGGGQRPSMRDIAARQRAEAPAGRRAGVGTGGWQAYRAARAARSERYKRVEVPKTGHLIFAFCTAEPLAYIFRHWVDRRPYTCIRDIENGIDCPLCDAGDRAKEVVFYDVVDLSDTSVYVWEMTADPIRKIQVHYDQLADMDPPRTLDNEEYYFVVSKQQKDRSSWEYTIQRVKARDLLEEWGVEPLTGEERAACLENLHDDSIVYVSSREDLTAAVDKLED